MLDEMAAPPSSAEAMEDGPSSAEASAAVPLGAGLRRDKIAGRPEQTAEPEAEPAEKNPKLLRLERQLEQLEKMRERLGISRSWGPRAGGKTPNIEH
jgi:hypothetical protein